MKQAGCVSHLIGYGSNILAPTWLRRAEPAVLSEAGSRTVKASLLSVTAQSQTGILSLWGLFFCSCLSWRTEAARPGLFPHGSLGNHQFVQEVMERDEGLHSILFTRGKKGCFIPPPPNLPPKRKEGVKRSQQRNRKS